MTAHPRPDRCKQNRQARCASFNFIFIAPRRRIICLARMQRAFFFPHARPRHLRLYSSSASRWSNDTKIKVGRHVSTLQDAVSGFFDAPHPVTPYTRDAASFLFRIRRPFLELHQLSLYLSLLACMRRLLAALYPDAHHMQLLPTPGTPPHLLLAEQGILCLHWKLVLRRRRRHLLPPWLLDMLRRRWLPSDTSPSEAPSRSSGSQAAGMVERSFQGLSYFHFDAQGDVVAHVVERLIPPPSRSWLWFMLTPWQLLERVRLEGPSKPRAASIPPSSSALHKSGKQG